MAKKDFTEARALVDIHLSNDVRIICNSIVSADKDFMKQYAEFLDATPEAVTYAKSEGAGIIDAAELVAAIGAAE